MLTISKPLSAGQAAAYHAAEFTNAKENYYSAGTEITGQWFGRLAEHFGLRGDVNQEHFRRLADGQDPTTGRQLIRMVAPHTYENAKGETVKRMGHRAGWDATFSAPKTVSLVALVGGDERVRIAHRESVLVALAALETYTQARMGDIRPPETTRMLAAATFEHDSARPVSGYSAPQLHTHVVVFNMTRTESGLTRSVQPRELYKAQAFATAAYRAELALRLKALGYELDRGKSGQPDIKGFSEEYLDAASPRRLQIKKRLLEQGRSGAEASQIAAHQTREPKVQRTREEVQAQHQAMAAEHGYQPQRAVALAQQSVARKQQIVVFEQPDANARDAVQYAKDRNMERSAVVEDRAIYTDALKRGMGLVGWRAVHEEFERRYVAGEFVLRTPAPGSAARAFTTPQMLALERAMIDRMLVGRGQHPSVASPAVRAAIDRDYPSLNPDQRASVERILARPDQVQALEGIAGSGKTTALAAIRDGAERAGFQVRGLAPTSRATAHLAEAGMPTQTLQRFLERGNTTVANRDDGRRPHLSIADHLHRGITPDDQPRLLVLDESSLASTKLMKEFLDRMQPTDRVLLVGDTRQHQSVDAGKAFQQLQELGLEAARLDQVVRQRGEGYRRIVERLAAGDVTTALADLTRRGKVHEIPDRAKRLDALGAAFITNPQGTLVVAPDNASRTELNEVIHRALQAQRTVAPDQQPTRVLVARHDLTGADRAYADRYDVGDIVRYTKASRTYGIAAGEYATVTARDRRGLHDADRWDPAGPVTADLRPVPPGGEDWCQKPDGRAANRLTVQRETGASVTYDASRLRGVSVYQAQERAFAPGDRVQFTAPNRALGVANRELGTLERLTHGHATIALDSGRRLTFAVADHPHLDYGYAVTSHSSQGQTADRVIVHVDSLHSAEAIVNQRFAYVALSRGRFDAQVYTDNKAQLGHNLTRDVSHRAAIEQEV